MSLFVHALDEPHSWYTKVWLIEKNYNRNAFAKPVEFEFEEQSNRLYKPVDPTFKFEMETGDELLRAFAQAAWDRGWRPQGHSDELSAMKDHLEDMRTLVFNKEKGPALTASPKVGRL